MRQFILMLPALLISFPLLAQPEATESVSQQPGLRLSSKDIDRFQIFMADDNPFLNLMPGLRTDDDYGYTYGLRISYNRIKPEGHFAPNERWSIDASTDLYTENETPAGQNLFPHSPQKFNEISHLRVRWDDLFNKIDSDQLYYVVGAGIGLKNTQKSSGVLAAGEAKSWHRCKHDKLTPEMTDYYDDQPGDTHQAFVSVTAAIGKIVSFSDRMKDCACEIDRIKVEAGGEILSIRTGSRIYFLAAVNKSLFTFLGRDISVDAELEATQYGDGNRDFKKTIGMRLTGKKWTLKSGFTFVSGSQNNQFLQYNGDKDPIWGILVERKVQ